MADVWTKALLVATIFSCLALNTCSAVSIENCDDSGITSIAGGGVIQIACTHAPSFSVKWFFQPEGVNTNHSLGLCQQKLQIFPGIVECKNGTTYSEVEMNSNRNVTTLTLSESGSSADRIVGVLTCTSQSEAASCRINITFGGSEQQTTDGTITTSFTSSSTNTPTTSTSTEISTTSTTTEIQTTSSESNTDVTTTQATTTSSQTPRVTATPSTGSASFVTAETTSLDTSTSMTSALSGVTTTEVSTTLASMAITSSSLATDISSISSKTSTDISAATSPTTARMATASSLSTEGVTSLPSPTTSDITTASPPTTEGITTASPPTTEGITTATSTTTEGITTATSTTTEGITTTTSTTTEGITTASPPTTEGITTATSTTTEGITTASPPTTQNIHTASSPTTASTAVPSSSPPDTSTTDVSHTSSPTSSAGTTLAGTTDDVSPSSGVGTTEPMTSDITTEVITTLLPNTGEIATTVTPSEMTSSTESSTIADKGPTDNREPLPMAAIAGGAVVGLIVVVVIIIALVICDRKRKARKRPDRKLSEDSDENDYESILNATYINPNAADITSKPNSHPGHSQLPDPRRGSDQHLAKKRPDEDTESVSGFSSVAGTGSARVMKLFAEALDEGSRNQSFADSSQEMDTYNRLGDVIPHAASGHGRGDFSKPRQNGGRNENKGPRKQTSDYDHVGASLSPRPPPSYNAKSPGFTPQLDVDGYTKVNKVPGNGAGGRHFEPETRGGQARQGGYVNVPKQGPMPAPKPKPGRGGQAQPRRNTGDDYEHPVLSGLGVQVLPRQALNQMPAKDRYNDNDVYNRLDHAQRPQEPRDPYFVYSHIGSF